MEDNKTLEKKKNYVRRRGMWGGRNAKIWPLEHVCHAPDYKSFFQFSIVGAVGISRRPRRRYILRSLYAFILTKFSPSPVTVDYFLLSRWEKRNTVSNWEILKENVVSDPVISCGPGHLPDSFCYTIDLEIPWI